MKNRVLCIFILVFVSGVACSDQTGKSGYKSEAVALCDAFTPETWGEDFQKLTPVEKASMLQKKIQAAVKSDKMKQVYQTLITDAPEKAYENYAKNVSDLIGETHKCTSIENYFGYSTQ